jgi:hypothetical protein
MLGKSLPSQLNNDGIDSIIESSLPILIACLWKDQDFNENLKNLDSIAAYFHKEMHVYYALEDTLIYFSNRYRVLGTPTYLILHQGKVLGTILGKVSNRKLIKHATIILLDHQKHESARDTGRRHLNEK